MVWYLRYPPCIGLPLALFALFAVRPDEATTPVLDAASATYALKASGGVMILCRDAFWNRCIINPDPIPTVLPLTLIIPLVVTELGMAWREQR